MSNEPIDICFFNFSTRFFTDISCEEAAFEITFKLVEDVLKTYRAKITNSLPLIAENFKNCVESQSGKIITNMVGELGNIIIYLAILTALLMILLVVILGMLAKTNRPDVIIGFVLFFVIIYLVVGWILINNSFNIISNEITEEETIVNNCFETALTEIDTYVRDENLAINTALCSYPESESAGCT